MKKHVVGFILLLLLLTTGCNTDVTSTQQNNRSNDEIYEASVHDAMIAGPNEICSTLVAIRPDNSYLKWSNGYVLVVTWTGHGSSYPVGDTVTTWWSETWVTAVPEMQDWYQKHPVSKDNLTLRTEQLLGMPANSGCTYFIEMWVKPTDLLRPAYDNEIDDNVCGLDFTSSTSRDYITWFNENIISSYYVSKDETKYPWTRLGYTYDWGNPDNEVGLSEFIVKKNAKVIVKSKSLTREYIL